MTLLAAGSGAPSGGSDRSLAGRLRSVFITGAAVAIPLIVTVIVLVFVVNFILNTISPVVFIAKDALGLGQELPRYVLEILAVLTLLAVIFLIGAVAELRSGKGLERAFDTAMARIPGVGSVYTSFNEMSELLLSNDTQSFREVKLVEFPTRGSYTVGFVTADPPDEFTDATDHDDMTTLFMPLAPNPVMGGFVLHVSTGRVYDVDITVEEGIRSIVTSGVATGDTDQPAHDGELIDLAGIRKQAADGMEDIGAWGARTADDITDFSEMTRDELEEITTETWNELVTVHPDIDPEDVDDSSPTRHYMLDEDGEDDPSGDGETGGAAADQEPPTEDERS